MLSTVYEEQAELQTRKQEIAKTSLTFLDYQETPFDGVYDQGYFQAQSVQQTHTS